MLLKTWQESPIHLPYTQLLSTGFTLSAGYCPGSTWSANSTVSFSFGFRAYLTLFHFLRMAGEGPLFCDNVNFQGRLGLSSRVSERKAGLGHGPGRPSSAPRPGPRPRTPRSTARLGEAPPPAQGRSSQPQGGGGRRRAGRALRAGATLPPLPTRRPGGGAHRARPPPPAEARPRAERLRSPPATRAARTHACAPRPARLPEGRPGGHRRPHPQANRRPRHRPPAAPPTRAPPPGVPAAPPGPDPRWPHGAGPAPGAAWGRAQAPAAARRAAPRAGAGRASATVTDGRLQQSAAGAGPGVTSGPPRSRGI